MIKTERLVIKSYSDSDYDQMYELLTNNLIKETYVIPDFQSSQEVKNFFNKLIILSQSNNHYEKGIYLNNHLIGFVNDVEIENDTIEIGYVIHPNHHNLGYASEMLNAVIKDLFGRGFNTIKCCAFESNHASFRVMEKCNMKPMNHFVEMIHQSKKQRCEYYSISRND